MKWRLDPDLVIVALALIVAGAILWVALHAHATAAPRPPAVEAPVTWSVAEYKLQLDIGDLSGLLRALPPSNHTGDVAIWNQDVDQMANMVSADAELLNQLAQQTATLAQPRTVG